MHHRLHAEARSHADLRTGAIVLMLGVVAVRLALADRGTAAAVTAGAALVLLVWRLARGPAVGPVGAISSAPPGIAPENRVVSAPQTAFRSRFQALRIRPIMPPARSPLPRTGSLPTVPDGGFPAPRPSFARAMSAAWCSRRLSRSARPPIGWGSRTP